MKQNDMPIGFSMALAMNPEALRTFAALSEEEQQQIIDKTHAIRSKDEMHRYVSSLVREQR